MSKNVLIISTSPRKGSNSDLLRTSFYVVHRRQAIK